MDKLGELDFNKIEKLYALTKTTFDSKSKIVEPIKNVILKENLNLNTLKRLKKIGIEKIINGKYAVVTMAGGQGTRLGANGPKGTYMLEVLGTKKSIFEILVDKLKLKREEYGISIPWYIMTSKENNNETIKFFEDNNYFDYGKSNIMFFEQGELPMLDMDGNVILTSSGIKFASNGNGGVFEALKNSGMLKQMKEKNIEYILFSGVDNILANFTDEIFLGGLVQSGFMAGSKSILKSQPEERVGVFCRVDNRPSVIEYTELPAELASMKKENGELVYSEANIVSNMFRIDLLEDIPPLPYHVAKKTCKAICNGVEKEIPAYKFEMFIFDIYKNIDDLFVYRVKREEEFAPIKNKEGTDSPETAVKLYNNFYSKA